MKKKCVFTYSVDNVRMQDGPYGISLYIGDTVKNVTLEFDVISGEDILVTACRELAKSISYQEHSILCWSFYD